MSQLDRTFSLRDAVPEDAACIAGLVRDLATYEKLAHEAVATEADFAAALFDTPPRACAMIAEAAGAPVGLALYFYNFSTFLGRHGLYVEDVFVQPALRGMGIGRAFFAALAARAVAQGCGRMEWAVLDWNEPAIGFYQSLGAQGMSDWTTQRLTGEALHALAAQAGHRDPHPRDNSAHEATSVALDALARTLVDAGLSVHKSLGPGLLESTYEHCLAHELGQRGISFVRQVPLPLIYKGERIEAGFRLDLLVENAIIIEVKAVESLTPLHAAQLLTYLKLSRFQLGFLMNFNVSRFTYGVRRMVR